MVGFSHQDKDNGNNLPSKLKSSIDQSWSEKLDFLELPEIEDFSLPADGSFPDFDCFRDWIGEMQDPEVGQNCKSEVGFVEKQVALAQNNQSAEGTFLGSTMLSEVAQERGILDCSDTNGSRDAGIGFDAKSTIVQGVGPVGDDFSSKLDVENMSIPKTDHPAVVGEELLRIDDPVESFEVTNIPIGNSSPGKSGDGVILLSLNTVVEEGLEKVSLVDGAEIKSFKETFTINDATLSEVSPGDNYKGSGSESESESSSTSSSSSSSSSSGEDDDDDQVAEEGGKKKLNIKGLSGTKEELEEGEIMDTDACNMVCWSNGDSDDDTKDSVIECEASDLLVDDDFLDEDEIGVTGGPIKSKNEINVLPPVLPVDVTLQACHQMLPVGLVSSILGTQIIVDGAEKHSPLSEGSILWMTERRSPLGRVDEIFGPVKNPYYIVRYNSESDVPQGIHEGTLVSFVAEFVDHVLNNKNIYQKGYDASGDHDEELPEEVEFSDDEKEAEYRRMLKMSKRGNDNEKKPRANKKKNNFKRNDTFPRNYQSSPSNSMQANDSSPVQPGNFQNQRQIESARPLADNSIRPSSSGFNPAFSAGQGMFHGFSQPGQPSFPVGPRPGFPQQNQPSGFQTQNAGFPGGFQTNNSMPWIQQQNLQQALAMLNAGQGPPFQQAFNPAGQALNSGTPFPPNANGGPPFSPWPTGSMVPDMLNQVPLAMALQAQLAILAGQAGGSNMQQFSQGLPQNNNMQQFSQGLPQNNNNMQQFSQGLPPNNSNMQQFSQSLPQNNSNIQQQSPQNLPQNNQVPQPQFNLGSSSGRGGRHFQHRGGRSRGGGGRGRGDRQFRSR